MKITHFILITIILLTLASIAVDGIYYKVFALEESCIEECKSYHPDGNQKGIETCIKCYCKRSNSPECRGDSRNTKSLVAWVDSPNVIPTAKKVVKVILVISAFMIMLGISRITGIILAVGCGVILYALDSITMYPDSTKVKVMSVILIITILWVVKNFIQGVRGR